MSFRPGYAWSAFWMRFAGAGRAGRFAMRLAALPASPYRGSRFLADLSPAGFIAASAVIEKDVALERGCNTFIGERVIISKTGRNVGPVILGDRAHVHYESVIDLGPGGAVSIGANSHIQSRCQLTSIVAPITIGDGVQIAPYCCVYSYDHTFAPGAPILAQPLKSKGGVVIDDGAWLGVGVIVVDGVRIGKGAVIGAGSVVMHSVPDGAIAMGVPARVVRMREDLPAAEPPEEPVLTPYG